MPLPSIKATMTLPEKLHIAGAPAAFGMRLRWQKWV